MPEESRAESGKRKAENGKRKTESATTGVIGFIGIIGFVHISYLLSPIF